MSTPTTVKFKTSTCVLCRQRKLRCDGGNPCGPCSRARTLVVCTYVSKAFGQLRSEPRKGGACSSCRQRKRRCDGSLCLQDKPRARKSKHAELTYQDRLSADASGASMTSSRSTNPSQPYTPEYSASIDLPSTSAEDEFDIRSLLGFYPAESESSSLYLTPTSNHWLPGVYSESAVPGVPEYTPSDKFAVNCPSRSLHPVGFSPEPAPALDRTAELFELRQLFLAHSWHYGLNVTEEKRDALSRGDTSGLFVHPILVNISQLLGYHLVRRLQSETLHYCRGPTAGREAEQAMQIFEILQAEESMMDPTTTMHVYNLLAVYYTLNRDLAMFAQLFNKLGALMLYSHTAYDNLVLDVSSQVDQPSCSPQGMVDEARSAFSATIFLQLGVSLARKTPPVLDASFLVKFRKLAAMHRWDTELNFMRARSALFVYDARRLVAKWEKSEFGDRLSGTMWSNCYWDLIEDVHAYLKVVNTPLIEVSFIHVAQVFTLKTCIIIALATLANLYALFAPIQPESERKHKEVIEEIASMTTMFLEKDFQYLDTTLMVCWGVALRPLLGAEPFPKWDEVSAVIAPPKGGSSASLSIIRKCFQRISLATPCIPKS
ncbi:hypothetical protein B0H19DRAFT_1155796 [Mycena capillaripes]|nr:hypothetical protein B0H19DRAFT_1155796 [Mycena capillaripes]